LQRVARLNRYAILRALRQARFAAPAVARDQQQQQQQQQQRRGRPGLTGAAVAPVAPIGLRCVDMRAAANPNPQPLTPKQGGAWLAVFPRARDLCRAFCMTWSLEESLGVSSKDDTAFGSVFQRRHGIWECLPKDDTAFGSVFQRTTRHLGVSSKDGGMQKALDRGGVRGRGRLSRHEAAMRRVLT